MTLVQAKSCPAQKDWGFKAFTGSLFQWLDRSYYKNSQGLNKPEPFEAPVETLESFVLPLKDLKLDVAQYTINVLNQII